tara:strand:+ start:379 stop:555 length:177 start_codon:yes stop_codon:yes gene_type:complete
MSLKRLREIEPKLATASDEEVALIREKIYELAHIAYDSYELQSGSNFSVGSEDVDEEK